MIFPFWGDILFNSPASGFYHRTFGSNSTGNKDATHTKIKMRSAKNGSIMNHDTPDNINIHGCRKMMGGDKNGPTSKGVYSNAYICYSSQPLARRNGETARGRSRRRDGKKNRHRQLLGSHVGWIGQEVNDWMNEWTMSVTAQTK